VHAQVPVLTLVLTQFLPFGNRLSDNFERGIQERAEAILRMKLHRSRYCFIFLIWFVAPCFAHHMAVVVDKDNKVENVTSVHLAKMLRGEIRKWPDGRDVVLVFHKASSGERATLERLMKISESELQPLISAHRNFVRVVGSDTDVIDLVGATPGGVGLVDVRSISGSINVVKVDGKLPTENGYLPH